jgi:predicted lipid-binding transport protein (Tim44 family)
MSAAVAYAAQEPIVFPAKGQSNEKMESDKYSCYTWAKGQTGFDPMQAPTATAPPPPTKGGAVKGAAGGALAGAAIGAIAGDAGKGAAIGAASGGIVGGARKQRSNKEQEQYAQQQAAGYDQKRSEYNRAWGACMEGKGYTVK